MISPKAILVTDEGIILSVERSREPEFIEQKALKLGLERKREFHITLIGKRTWTSIDKLIADRVDKKDILAFIRNLSIQTYWNIIELEEYFLVGKSYSEDDDRQTIIQRVDIVGIEEFYEKINLLLSNSFPIPYGHVTLYSKSTREEKMLRGIGIYSKDEFESLQPEKITA